MPGFDLNSVLSQIQTGAGVLQYAAQTFLPNHPQTVNAPGAGFVVQGAGTSLAQLQAGAQSTVPPGTGGDFLNQGQAVIGGIISQGLHDLIPGGPATANDAARAATGAVAGALPDVAGIASWLDIQRVGFLVLGVGLIFIGVTMIVRQTGDVGLDNQLKRAQLKLTEDQVQTSKAAKTRQTLRANKVAARAARRAASRPTLAYDRDHAGDARPDFGPPLIEQDIRSGPSGKARTSLNLGGPPKRKRKPRTAGET